ncbi:MAG: hypothetical protein JWO20_249 [Candidatus Angelobacter sp.]|nr:hypothetical protein [Candidatus Angelobacter sp.]
MKKGTRKGALLRFCERDLRCATCFLWSGGSGEHVGVRIAVSSAERAGWTFELEPLQKRFVLRMVSERVSSGGQSDGIDGVGQAFDHVTIFEIVLAIAVR